MKINHHAVIRLELVMNSEVSDLRDTRVKINFFVGGDADDAFR